MYTSGGKGPVSFSKKVSSHTPIFVRAWGEAKTTNYRRQWSTSATRTSLVPRPNFFAYETDERKRKRENFAYFALILIFAYSFVSLGKLVAGDEARPGPVEKLQAKGCKRATDYRHWQFQHGA